MTHATISRSGEVDFPLWVKAVAGMLSIFMPIAIMGAAWQGSQIFDISLRMARIETRLDDASAQKAAAADALARAKLLEQRMERAERDLTDIKQQSGLK
jgi:hypothetical protein